MSEPQQTLSRASEPSGESGGQDLREVRNENASRWAMAKECGLAADVIVRKRRLSQADRDGVVMLLRRAERMLLEEK